MTTLEDRMNTTRRALRAIDHDHRVRADRIAAAGLPDTVRAAQLVAESTAWAARRGPVAGRWRRLRAEHEAEARRIETIWGAR
jgi:hypothetical protein